MTKQEGGPAARATEGLPSGRPGRERGRRRTAALLRGRKPHFVWGFHVPAPEPLRASTPAPLPALCGWEGAVSVALGGPGGAAGRASPCRSTAPASSLVSGQMISTDSQGHVPLLAARPDQTGGPGPKPAPSLAPTVPPATVYPGIELEQLQIDFALAVAAGSGDPRSGPAQPVARSRRAPGAGRRRQRPGPPSWAARAGRAVKRLRRCFAALRPWWVTARPARALATRRAVRRRLQPT